LYVSKTGSFKALAANFNEDFIVFDTTAQMRKKKIFLQKKKLYEAAVSGLGDYCGKNGFKKCVLGVSGGIDSALTWQLPLTQWEKIMFGAFLMPSRHYIEGIKFVCGRYLFKTVR
jgi:hypothetical protein